MRKQISWSWFSVVISFYFICLTTPGIGQKQEGIARAERKAILKDTLDGKFDFSRFLINAHGFIPVPIIITEPALGGFGGLIAPVFLQPKKIAGYTGYVPPIAVGPDSFGYYIVFGHNWNR